MTVVAPLPPARCPPRSLSARPAPSPLLLGSSLKSSSPRPASSLRLLRSERVSRRTRRRCFFSSDLAFLADLGGLVAAAAFLFLLERFLKTSSTKFKSV